MKNILLWAGIAVLAFQDYFKKQPVKPTRRQQFLQTGETSQAFIEGIMNPKKIISYYFGKPTKEKDEYSSFTLKENFGPYYFYRWKVKSFFLDLEKYNDYVILALRNIDESIEKSSYIFEDDIMFEIGEIMIFLLFLLEAEHKTEDNRYKQLADIAEIGDWQLALEIAKGQGMI